jgi:5-methylcytosine-specific restriction endonuclease McrA
VKRAVRERDGDQCAFVGESGQRCSSRTRLEFDHVEPVSCGGAATVENLRLLCRAHNQYAAEREFGAEFMEQKRAAARRPHALKRDAGPRRARPILLSGAAANRPLPAPPFLAARAADGLD